MKQLKIVYISRSIIPSRTANSLNVIKMCATFASLGHEVTLLAPITKKLEEKGVKNIYEFYGVENNFEIKKLFSPNIKFLKKRIYSFRCLNQVKKIKPDFVYGRDDMFAFYLTQKSGYKTLFERHDDFTDDKYKLDEKLFKRFILENKSSSKLVAITQKLKEFYIKEYDIKDSSIHIAPSATQISKDFTTIPTNCEKFKDSFNVGYIGKLSKGKGIEIIIQIAQNLPNMIFHIVGGKKEDVEYWQNKSGNLKNIIFHGFINPKDTFKYRNLCDILLAPYLDNDGIHRDSEFVSPIKTFEYMGSKTPMICSDLRVLRECIDERFALLVDNKDINSWIKAVEKLYNDHKFREDLTQNAYEHCVENFTYEARCRNIIDFMKK
ncbi:glycosyltransferase [Aliarcobacter cryaerophilus]|uniref:Glycosyltransferase n=1 Tax=Aliarcobacter cryaerophilus TaxID=28198 RepID=A0A7G9LPY9_9BACT|nr:glycosyltransferase [Aliarcobacter cryaerophilus]MCT7493192.1 glycosyltransferase [Aliarcobacter cryaerophilus]QNM90688.1 glycosyltransferase [Aliarcobacter cryaerophilus]